MKCIGRLIIERLAGAAGPVEALRTLQTIGVAEAQGAMLDALAHTLTRVIELEMRVATLGLNPLPRGSCGSIG